MSRFFMALTALFAFAFTGMLQAGDLVAQQQQLQQGQTSITGTITELNDNEVTLRTDDQRSVTVKVDRQTRFLDEAGERVEVRADDLLGSLDSGDRVVVQTRVGQGGEHFAVSIEMWSAERHEARGGAADRERQREEQRQAQTPITGTITELKDDAVTLRTEDQGSITVKVDRQTRLLDEAGRRVEAAADALLGSLSSGDRVVVQTREGQGGERFAVSIEKWSADRHEARGGAAVRERQPEVRRATEDSIAGATTEVTGTITSIGENRVTLRTDDQRSMTVGVDRQTRMLDESGQRVAAREGDLLGSLSSGDRVVVSFRTGDGTTERTAVSIAKREVAVERQPERAELPRTSSALPLIALMGLIGLAGAGALSVAARREQH
jgi:preprotein translocase subunit YajC